MKILFLGMSAMFIVAMTGSILAEDMSHDMEQGMAMEEGHSTRQMGSMGGTMEEMGGGETVHTGVEEGYHFSYHLMDIQEKMAAMKAAGHAHEGTDATHHLMVYIKDPNGAAVENAQVGYLVEGPDGSKQKLMCMDMGGGYGSDVNLSGTGDYVIKTKVVAGDTKLINEFVYKAED